MKHLLVLSLGLVTAATSANAAPFALDYNASDTSCIDASRFSDQVSAKLGFVPWDSAASAKIRVRVERDGGQFTGTFRNIDGSAKVIDGKTCADVTDSLVLTVATAVDATPAKAPANTAPAASAVADGTIPVTFKSVEGYRLSVAAQKASGYGVASNGARVAAAYFDNLCTSPCTAGVPQGRNYLMFSDPDHDSYGGDTFLIDHPTTLTLAHKSRHGTRVWMVAGGAVAAGLGTLWMTQMDCSSGGGSCLGPVLGGSSIATLGLTSMLLSLFVHDTFTVTQSP